MTENRNPIVVPYGVMRRLQAEGLGTQPTIRKALRGTYNPGNLRERTRAMRIRIRALLLGGTIAQKGGEE